MEFKYSISLLSYELILFCVCRSVVISIVVGAACIGVVVRIFFDCVSAICIIGVACIIASEQILEKSYDLSQSPSSFA